jgi:hypothetical protein
MSDAWAELREALGAAVGAGSAGAHSAPEALLAYRAGELEPLEEERLRHHLLSCRECVGLLLEADLLRPGRTLNGPADPEAETAWEALRPRLREEGAGSVTAFAPVQGRAARGEGPARDRSRGPVPTGRPWASGPRWLWSLAASLLVATLGLSAWVVRLRGTVGELSRPQLNAQIVDLYPASPQRGETVRAAALALAPDAQLFTLILNPTEPGDFTDYRLEAIRPEGGLVLRLEGLSRNEYGSFVLTLSRRSLGPGEYRLRLYGLAGGAAEPIEDFTLWIEED